jgi:hypothetical protein
MKESKNCHEEYTPEGFKTIDDFYPFYLSQHSYNLCRLLHYTGTIIATTHLLLAIFYLYLLYIPIGMLYGYGFAWVGHFFVEKNRPATFKHPFLSFACDYVMLYHFLTGQINHQFKKYNLKNRKFIPADFL